MTTEGSICGPAHDSRSSRSSARPRRRGSVKRGRGMRSRLKGAACVRASPDVAAAAACPPAGVGCSGSSGRRHQAVATASKHTRNTCAREGERVCVCAPVGARARVRPSVHVLSVCACECVRVRARVGVRMRQCTCIFARASSQPINKPTAQTAKATATQTHSYTLRGGHTQAPPPSREGASACCPPHPAAPPPPPPPRPPPRRPRHAASRTPASPCKRHRGRVAGDGAVRYQPTARVQHSSPLPACSLPAAQSAPRPTRPRIHGPRGSIDTPVGMYRYMHYVYIQIYALCIHNAYIAGQSTRLLVSPAMVSTAMRVCPCRHASAPCVMTRAHKQRTARAPFVASASRYQFLQPARTRRLPQPLHGRRHVPPTSARHPHSGGFALQDIPL